MSKLSRVTSLLFGSTAGTDEIAQFGSLAAASPHFSTDPAVIQSLPNFLEGWFGAILGNNSPTIEDMNALFFVLYYQLGYMFQAGIPEYDASTTYYIGSMINVSGSVYISLTDNNIGHSPPNPTYWRASNGSVVTITTNTTATASNDLILVDATSGEVVVNVIDVTTFPTGKRITVKKIDSSSNIVVLFGIIDGKGSYVLPNEYDAVTIENNGNGIEWSIVSSSLVPSVAISPTCNAFSTTGGPTAVTGLSATILTIGNPVVIELVSDGSNNYSTFGGTKGTGLSVDVFVLIFEGTDVISRMELASIPSATGGAGNLLKVPVSSVRHVYQPAPGTHTYTIQVIATSGNTVFVNYAQLVAYELK